MISLSLHDSIRSHVLRRYCTFALLLRKQGRTHKWCTLMDPHTWPCKSRTTSTNIPSATMWGYRMLSRRPAWGDERLGKVAREGQGYPRYQHDMMMMIMMMKPILILTLFRSFNITFNSFWYKNFVVSKSKMIIGLMSRVLANDPGDWGLIPCRVIPKTQKMVLDSALLNIQHYKVRIKGKIEQSREWTIALLYTSV